MIREQLQSMVTLLEKGGFKTSYSLVLQHGTEFKGVDRPAHVNRRIPKECFSNSLQLALDLGLTYVEGYCLSTNVPVLVHHAWCIDENRTVIDSTLEDPSKYEYIGIPMDFDFAMNVALKTGYYGVLDNHRFREIYDMDPRQFMDPHWVK